MDERLGPGTSHCLCDTCGEYFNSVTAFDNHRIGWPPAVRRCLTPDEMRAKGWSLNTRGLWITKAYAGYQDEGEGAA